MEWLDHLLTTYPWGIYLCFFIAPFIQEDAAVIGAAAASSSGTGDPTLLFASILAGLTLSDVWKYWLGRAALTQGWARRFAEKPGVQTARDRVVNRLGASLMAVRFIPGTRIPFYVASGLFKAPFGRFAFFVSLSAAAYILIAFCLFHALGAVLGEKVKAWMPIIALSVIISLVALQWIRGRDSKASS